MPTGELSFLTDAGIVVDSRTRQLQAVNSTEIMINQPMTMQKRAHFSRLWTNEPRW